MFTARFLAPRNLSDSCTDAITTPRRSKLFQLHAARHRHPNSSLPATQCIDANFMKPLDDDSFTLAPAFDNIDVVGVAPEPLLPETIQPAVALPAVAVASAEATPVESIVPAPDIAPANIEALPTLAVVEEITATFPVMTSTAMPVVSPASEIVVVVPAMLAVEDALGTVAPPPIDAAPTPAEAPPTTLKKTKKRGRKTENEGLSAAGRKRKPRWKSATRSGASGTTDITFCEGRMPIYALGGTISAHSPP
jgi:hypothetical protein